MSVFCVIVQHFLKAKQYMRVNFVMLFKANILSKITQRYLCEPVIFKMNLVTK